MGATTTLLKNATILVPSGQPNDYVVPLRDHDLLIEDKKIKQIAPGIPPPSPETQIIDCTGKVVSPGFIDTHHHLWQTQLKGRHANHTLLEYMPTGQFAVSSHGHDENTVDFQVDTDVRQLPELELHTPGHLLG